MHKKCFLTKFKCAIFCSIVAYVIYNDVDYHVHDKEEASFVYLQHADVVVMNHVHDKEEASFVYLQHADVVVMNWAKSENHPILNIQNCRFSLRGAFSLRDEISSH
jgi:hypothetical protein